MVDSTSLCLVKTACYNGRTFIVKEDSHEPFCRNPLHKSQAWHPRGVPSALRHRGMAPAQTLELRCGDTRSSLHDENSYYVIRRFEGLAQREQSEDIYYASDDWRQGPREAILALIEGYADIVLELDEVTVQRLRR